MRGAVWMLEFGALILSVALNCHEHLARQQRSSSVLQDRRPGGHGGRTWQGPGARRSRSPHRHTVISRHPREISPDAARGLAVRPAAGRETGAGAVVVAGT